MEDLTSVEKEIMTVHDLFWTSYAKRDLDLRFSLCDDQITFIGTGPHERAANKKEYRAINEKGVEEYPEPFTIDFGWKKLTLFETVAWVQSEVVWNLVIEEQPYRELIVNTVVLKCLRGKWLVSHVHGSVPDYRFREGEYMASDQIKSRNAELEKQVLERTQELTHAMDNLKSTQEKLVQSEKMASLGELTAGIAHEIQNPLNFVNNFSEVNTELLNELKQEIEKGNPEAAKILADNLLDNESKILSHGKRADGIVKSMLQHSRLNTDKKELVDINILADEYLRLAYHGWKAKDRSFNAKYEIYFDPALQKIEIVHQDIGRVMLNLLNNAFYSVNKKMTELKESGGDTDTYEPAVSIRTRKKVENIEIIIKDNGKGIPSKTLDKIFIPFFTTKPAGQGTGLGLSLSYDIIRSHGGDLQVHTSEGEGAEFIITLPA